MWADRAFQMLCPVQPERKSECAFQDALKPRRGSVCLWEGRSAPLSPATPCPTQLCWKEMLPPRSGSQGEGRQLGMFFGCLVLLGVEQHWKKVRFPAPFLKCTREQGPALFILDCQEAFLFYFCFSFFFFLFLYRESRQNQKEAPVLIKTNKILYILVEFYTQLRWGWVTAEHRALSQDQDITTLESDEHEGQRVPRVNKTGAFSWNLNLFSSEYRPAGLGSSY